MLVRPSRSGARRQIRRARPKFRSTARTAVHRVVVLLPFVRILVRLAVSVPLLIRILIIYRHRGRIFGGTAGETRWVLRVVRIGGRSIVIVFGVRCGERGCVVRLGSARHLVVVVDGYVREGSLGYGFPLRPTLFALKVRKVAGGFLLCQFSLLSDSLTGLPLH